MRRPGVDEGSIFTRPRKPDGVCMYLSKGERESEREKEREKCWQC